MNDGHCLIVPMQHVIQATVLDEDVWDEIKVQSVVLIFIIVKHAVVSSFMICVNWHTCAASFFMDCK